MTDRTEQKILDAALGLFAEKGYAGATTRVIAQEAGVSELTLFRKFKTKENLFELLMNRNLQKMKKDFESILVNKKFECPRDFLEVFIRSYAGVIEENFEALILVISDSEGKFEPAAAEFFKGFTRYLKKNITDSKIDLEAFALTIAGFSYIICIEKYKGRTIFDYEAVIEKFINNAVLCIQ
jgi:TetR/AcrR family transcriptional regulator